MSQNDRLLSFLGGQSAPPSLYGSGRRVLFRCSSCGHPWLADGKNSSTRLDQDELATLAHDLHADLGALPCATCRLCAFATGCGAFEIDEYGQGRGGYGFNFEAAAPLGTHLLGTVLQEDWLARQQTMAPADVVHAPQTAHAVLHWLSTLSTIFCLGLIPPEESRRIAVGNRPGHGAAGTAGWQWKGGMFSLHCPPLGGSVIMVLAIALPPQELVSLSLLLKTWKLLASQANQGVIAGE